MSNPFTPFHTRSVLRFPPEALIRPCKLLIYKHFARFVFFVQFCVKRYWLIINKLDNCPVRKKVIGYLYKVLNIRLLRNTIASVVGIDIGSH